MDNGGSPPCYGVEDRLTAAKISKPLLGGASRSGYERGAPKYVSSYLLQMPHRNLMPF